MASSLVAAPPRERILLDRNWRFKQGDPPGCKVPLDYAAIRTWVLPTGNPFVQDPARRHARPAGNLGPGIAYVAPDFDDRSWESVDLPHDWAIGGPFTTRGGGGMGRLPTAGIGWYRRSLDISPADLRKSVFLDVDGAMSYAMVWLNGHFVGGWPYGYASWRVNLTAYLKPGANELAIRLDNPPDSSRWYPGAGLDRNVWLVKTQPVHVGHWGTFITTPKVSVESAEISLKVTVRNDSAREVAVSVSTGIFALGANDRPTGKKVAGIGPAELRIPAEAEATAEGTGMMAKPKLWGPPPDQKPNRYVAVTTVSEGGRVVDRYETRFGVRTLAFDPDRGFFINGEHVRLHGVCLHGDLGALGTAVNDRALQRQLEMLREMGCNAIRTSHNPPAPELLELADRMGFLVMDEAFDVWLREKTPNDYHLLFPDWHEQDLRAFIRRDRNSPSVILWSVGNEAAEQLTGETGAAVARELSDIVHEEDSTRPTASAMNWAKPGSPFAAAVDVIGLNYQGAGIRGAPGQYPAFHRRNPHTFIFSSETASTLSSRGVYLFPVAAGYGAAVGPDSGEDVVHHQVSAYELYYAPFGASPDRVFASQEQHPYSGGEFVWTGWDYLGEPTPFDSSRSSYSGIIDLAGFKKDRFYLYQAHWRPDYPMAHILPHWTWPERVGKVTPVQVFTSGDEGELFLNGKSLGRRTLGPLQYRLRWDHVVYEPGTLKVVTYKHGRPWATAIMQTAGAPAQLELAPDRRTIAANGRDLSFVTVRVADRNGVTAPRADTRIHFEVRGPGEIVATDNGDPTNLESFQSHDRNAFNGLCLVIVRGRPGVAGKITVTASAQGVETGAVTITARRAMTSP